MSTNHRQYYNNYDFTRCVQTIDEQYIQSQNGINLSKAVRLIHEQFMDITCSMMIKKYKQWILLDHPSNFVHHDQRSQNLKKKAISESGETIIEQQILKMNQTHRQVTYKTVSDIAIKQWHEENPTTTSIMKRSFI